MANAMNVRYGGTMICKIDVALVEGTETVLEPVNDTHGNHLQPLWDIRETSFLPRLDECAPYLWVDVR